MGLQGKTALVTGGARGIGLATAKRLLREGARCVLWDRDAAAVDAAKARLADDGEVTSDLVELAKPESVEAAAGQALGRHGQIDILVNNAGIAGASGLITLCSGTSSGGNSGAISLSTGSATGGRSGQVAITVGDGTSGTGGAAFSPSK